MNLEAELTECEGEVTDWLADGFAKKEIASELGKSIRTVENLTNSAYKKIGIQKVSELTKWWFMTRFSISQYEIEAKKRALGMVFVSLFFAQDMKFLPTYQLTRQNNKRRTTTAAPSGKRRNEIDFETEIYS